MKDYLLTLAFCYRRRENNKMYCIQTKRKQQMSSYKKHGERVKIPGMNSYAKAGCARETFRAIQSIFIR